MVYLSTQAPSKGNKVGRRKNHKCWREAIRFVAVSQPGAGAFLNAIPMRDDMKMESWATRVTVQRRLGLPLDVACQAVEAGKRAPSGRLHDVLGDAAMVNPRSKHATRHKFLLKRLVKCLRSAWGMIIEMEPTAHLSYSNPKQPDVAAANIGRGHRRLVADLKLTSSLASNSKGKRQTRMTHRSARSRSPTRNRPDGRTRLRSRSARASSASCRTARPSCPGPTTSACRPPIT